jgi:diguanylate cyclase (GGDEF)-like protein
MMGVVAARVDADPRLPVPVPAYGPLAALFEHVYELYLTGRTEEALTAAEKHEWIARAFGDEKTVSFLIQGRMYVYLGLGRFQEAIATGEALLRRHEAMHCLVEEAKTLSDLADMYVYQGQFGQSMRYFARAGRLLDTCPPRGSRYLSALSSLADAAGNAELYEFAASIYERLVEAWTANDQPVYSANHEVGYAEMLLLWALRLRQLGYEQDALTRARRAAAIAGRWRDGPEAHQSAATCSMAIALAILGEAGEACRLAGELILPARSQEFPWLARMAHLAYGLSLSAAGELGPAERELIAADELCRHGGRTDERLIIRYELSRLATEAIAPGPRRHVRDTLLDQARHLWDLRLQRMAMLRQAQQREELESRRATAERQMLHDPLTGLGNRRRFDQLLSALDEAPPQQPMAFLVIDIDKFKAVNDTYSHDTGDEVLRAVADAVQSHCRQAGDVAVRYAGDEFAVFLYSADLGSGIEVAERIRSAVHDTDFQRIAPGLVVTVSVGVAALEPGLTGPELFRIADQRLYHAKRLGRDQVAAD